MRHNFVKRLLGKQLIPYLYKQSINEKRSNVTHEKLFEQNIDGLKRSLSTKSRRMSRINDIALVTKCFCLFNRNKNKNYKNKSNIHNIYNNNNTYCYFANIINSTTTKKRRVIVLILLHYQFSYYILKLF